MSAPSFNDLLLSKVSELEQAIPTQHLQAPSVSKVQLGWHIEHSLLTINRIIGALEKSDPDAYKRKFNIGRLIMFKAKFFPRGRAQSPKAVIPKEFDEVTLMTHVVSTRERLPGLEQLEENKYFYHPYLGNLNVEDAKRFLLIHTEHHLKIIRDIAKAQ